MIAETAQGRNNFVIPSPNQIESSVTVTIESVDPPSANNPRGSVAISVHGDGASKSLGSNGENIVHLQALGTPTLYSLELEVTAEGWSFFSPAAQFRSTGTQAGVLIFPQSFTSMTFSLYNNLVESDLDIHYIMAFGLIQENETVPVWIDDPTFVLKPPD